MVGEVADGQIRDESPGGADERSLRSLKPVPRAVR
jgi:hypothetical protein